VTYERALIVSRATRLQELVNRFNTRAQARFYIESMGGDFTDYEKEDAAYHTALEEVERITRQVAKVQVIDRSLLPNYLFASDEVVLVVGQDGLVANTAKYALARPIIGINPEPARYDGILLPFDVSTCAAALRQTLAGTAPVEHVSMAEARLNDGQRLLAFNDLFIGVRSHVSVRYRISVGGSSERHSSSGILVCTGAGSTGWMSSVFNMAEGVGRLSGVKMPKRHPMPWSARQLLYVVREPFISRTSGASITAGVVGEGESIEIEAQTPQGGLIFSDGVDSDFLNFNSGAIAHVCLAADSAQLVVPKA
jgi:NAD kinase